MLRCLHNPMTRHWTLFIASIAFATTIFSFAGPDSTSQAQETAVDEKVNAEKSADQNLAKLIDRELFFGDPEISQAQLSPDGKFISFLKPYQGTRNIWFKKVDEPFDAAKPLTADKSPVPGYGWSQDGKYVLYIQDKGGDENYLVYSVDPNVKAEAESGVPPFRCLTPYENVRVAIMDSPKERPDTIILGINDRDPELHDVYEISISTGERKLIRENKDGVGGYDVDLEGNIRLATKQTDNGGQIIYRVDTEELVPLHETTFEESASTIQFHPDGKRVYLETNKGDADLTQLTLMNVETGELEVLQSDPEKQVDFGGAIFDAGTDELIGTSYLGDRLRIYSKDEQLTKDIDFLRKELPDGEIDVASSTKNMRWHLISVSSDVDPGSVYLYDREGPRVELLYRSRPDLPSSELALMKPIRYTARDGMEIPAYLTLPKGVEAKNLPLVVHPHGGPWARDTWGYDPYAQFLANRGYAVLQPNFRSSTGYGKKFLNAGNREWGFGSMQHDITDGVNHLIDQGIVDKEKICIFGGSYGGYATLAGVTFTPELYSCAIPYVAPSSLITLIESFPAYWRPFLEGTWYSRVGDPEVESDRADLIARSPLSHVDKIQCPLLVVHGANDPRVKKQESDQIVSELFGKGKPVQYICAPDEGHGFRSPENRMALAVAMENFLGNQLGGRVQESVPAEIAKRLEEITVDPASIVMSKDDETKTDSKEK